ncbi:MAG: hypothetical protein ACK5U7_10005 [Bacteroidota bacterium]|jgi:hypothetical protein
MDMLDMVRDVLELAENTSCAALDPAGARGRSKQAVAQSHIERRAREVQQTFTLSCNMFDDVTLTPDVNGYLVFDGSTLSAEPGENWPFERMSIIGNRVYNHKDNTYVFPEAVTLNVRRAFTPECLPNHVQLFVVARAALAMCDAAKDRARYARILEREREARISMLNEENALQRNRIPQKRRTPMWQDRDWYIQRRTT